MTKIKIGISIGDINGVGPEVIIKALQNPQILNLCTPIIFGSTKVLSYHKNIVDQSDMSFLSVSSAKHASDNKINVVNCWDENVNINLGKITEDGGKFAHIALERAFSALRDKEIDALVTAPINKAAMDPQYFPYSGHTEFLEDKFDAKYSLMMMVKDDLRIGVATNHLPIHEVAQAITADRLSTKMDLFYTSLIQDFGIEKPTLAVLGLNPHAGDNGKIGTEELEIIAGVVESKKQDGKLIYGPFSADGFFGSQEYSKYDGILAMYHDQGLIPFKLLAFGNGVNFTAGLPVLRTSPDHGTAYNIAGKNQASDSSMLQAIYLAMDLSRNRLEYFDARSKTIVKKPKQSEDIEE